MISAIAVPGLGCKDMDLLDVRVVGKVVDSRSLSSALEKLYFWERKLYSEVKVCLSFSDKELALLLVIHRNVQWKLKDKIVWCAAIFVHSNSVILVQCYAESAFKL